jgi:hypothetical protein
METVTGREQEPVRLSVKTELHLSRLRFPDRTLPKGWTLRQQAPSSLEICPEVDASISPIFASTEVSNQIVTVDLALTPCFPRRFDRIGTPF